MSKKLLLLSATPKTNSFLLVDVAFLARQRDKNKKEILNVYQIGRFLFSLKKNFINAAKL
jgi:hypothetical protein